MKGPRRRSSPAGAALVALLIAGCVGPSTGGTRLRVLSLGDSVPAGDVCACTPFPDLVAAGLAPDGAADVRRLASGGATAVDVTATVTRLDTEQGPTLGSPDVVLLEAGANDVVDLAGRPGADAAVQRAVDAVAGAVDVLSASGARVVVLDYWAVGLDGAVARRTYTPEELGAQVELTDDFDDHLAAAVGTRAVFVDLRPVFHGPHGTVDPTPLLAPDGDHPDARGHRAIADAVLTALAGSEVPVGSPGTG